MVTTPKIAPRMRRMSPEEWNARALQLAWNEHTIHTLRYKATDGTGNHIYTVASRSHPGHDHILILNLEHAHISCDCLAAEYGYPCAHIGAARHLMDQMIRSHSDRNMAGQRQYEWWAGTLDTTTLDAS